VNDSEDEYFHIVEPIEEQVFRKACDRQSPYVPQQRRPKSAQDANQWALPASEMVNVTAFGQRSANRRPDCVVYQSAHLPF